MALRPQHVAPELLTKVTKTLGITALDQWYYVSQHEATKAIGVRAFKKYGGSLASFLTAAYPQHQFDEEKLTTRNSLEKDQKFIEVIIRKLFPNTEIHTKARKAVGIINPETEAYLEIDFWIPSLKLGIEYQDKHHYGYQWYANDTLENYQKRDNIKSVAMSTMGYTLITIGYWWDKSIESIAATIRKFRPDLLQEFENRPYEPIPPEPPLGYNDASPTIPGVAGGIMSPFVPKANFNPTNWYGGEKHDGIRGIYNPKLNKMFSRSGIELSVLSSLLRDIPHILIEGEIVAGRGNYPKTTAISYHTQHDKVNWPMFRYVVFDLPDAKLGEYTQRYSTIVRELLSRPFVFAQPAFRVLLTSKSHLKTLVDSIISDAGEGVIAQQDARYEHGRAKGLAKIKVRRDADAQVLHVNKLSCTCKLINGVIAEIIFSTDFDPSYLRTGDIVSYYHDGYAQNNSPKRAEIYKVRYDLTWEDLVSTDKMQNTKRRSINEALGSRSLISRNIARYKAGYWNKSANLRAFFDSFAQKAGFDPLVPESWYPIQHKTVLKARGNLLRHYTLKQALMAAYPETKFDEKRFEDYFKPPGHWRKTTTIRAFFDEFARRAGFDPRVVENWYTLKLKDVLKAKGYLRRYYTLEEALAVAYPELKFDDERFRDQGKPSGYWKKSANVRAFFDKFAGTNGFEPLVAENWYPVRASAVRTAKGTGLLKAYSFDIKKALSSGYPELKFDRKKFVTYQKPRGYWNKTANVRTFFDEFARKAGFDPLLANNWYPVTIKDVLAAGGGILAAYRNKLMKAITSAYPEVQFEPAKFRTCSVPKVRNKMGHWNKPENVRTFFDSFARTFGFDPLVAENWYLVKGVTVQNAGGSGLLGVYGNNLRKALSHAYPELKFRTNSISNVRAGRKKAQPASNKTKGTS